MKTVKPFTIFRSNKRKPSKSECCNEETALRCTVEFKKNILYDAFDRLMIKVRQQEEKHGDLLKAGKQAKHRLEELAPGIQLMEKKGN